MFIGIRRVVTASANNIGTRQLTAKMGKEILLRSWRMYRQDAFGEAVHTGAGIKPGSRYDRGFNAHPPSGAVIQ
jgi:hypothetical protein